ncbi:unnamed protein product [Cunninghamella blakesleeana]
MLTKEQSPTPKAVNIVRPHSPLFNFIKPRSNSQISQNKHQQEQQHSSSPLSNQSGLSYSSSTSASSSPSTVSTLSGGSTLKNNKIQSPSILHTSTLGFNIFQAQQNSTSPPSTTYTSFFKSPPTSPPTSHYYDNIVNNNNNNNNNTNNNNINNNSNNISNNLHFNNNNNNNNSSNIYTGSTTHGFMNGFTPRFLRVRPTTYEETLLRPSSTLSLADIQQENENTSADENDDSDIHDDYDSIDGNTDSDDIDSLDDIDDTDLDDSDMSENDDDDNSSVEQSEDDNIPIKIVAKIKNGTIMNGKGVLVNKGSTDDDHLSWLDDPRANRKIADLEIEKSSLMNLNKTLESKVHEQEERIAKLEKQLQMYKNGGGVSINQPEWPLSPVSDKDMDEASFENLISTEVLTEDEIANDQVFQRLRSMLLGLIESAEEAVRLKTKVTGRVLTNYTDDDIKESFITLESPPILKPSTRTTPFSSSSSSSQNQKQNHNNNGAPTLQRQTPPLKKTTLRRASDVQDRIQKQTNELQPQTRKRTPMQRSLSRASSPAVLVSTDDFVNNFTNNNSTELSHQVSRPSSPKVFSPPMQRSSTRPRSYHQRRSQDIEFPKWHN